MGAGECWDLADRALRHAGADSSTTTGLDDDYEWGDPIDVSDVRPGDVLQFRDFVVTTSTTVDVTFADGSGSVDETEVEALRPHHTAIVDAILGTQHLIILEQQVKPLGKRVQRHTIPTQDLAPVVKTTHKTMKHSSGRMMPATVITTTAISVSGQIWPYRPQPKG